MIDCGEVGDAVRFSEELLAQSDALWTSARNNQESTIDEISALAILAAYHCDALAIMSNLNDAYTTAITALFQIAIDGNDQNREILLSVPEAKRKQLRNDITNNSTVTTIPNNAGDVITIIFTNKRTNKDFTVQLVDEKENNDWKVFDYTY